MPYRKYFRKTEKVWGCLRLNEVTEKLYHSECFLCPYHYRDQCTYTKEKIIIHKGVRTRAHK